MKVGVAYAIHVSKNLKQGLACTIGKQLWEYKLYAKELKPF